MTASHPNPRKPGEKDTQLVFSYGSNMSFARLRARVASARFVAVAKLHGHQLRFHQVGQDGSAKCDARQTGDPNHHVFGVICALDPADKPILDGYEGLGEGYQHKQVKVVTAQGGLLCWMYYATHIHPPLKPYDWYKEHVLVGARENGLPADYIARIEGVTAIPDQDTASRDRELAIYDGLATVQGAQS